MDILEPASVDDLPSGMLEDLKRIVTQQQNRQIKRIELLKKQASLANEQQFLWAQKQYAEFKRLENVEQETQRRKEMENFHRKLVQNRRETVLQASHRGYESRRRALLKKLQEADRRAEQKSLEKTSLALESTRKSMETSLKRERAKKMSDCILESQRKERLKKLERLDARAQEMEEAREMDARLRLHNEQSMQRMREEARARRDHDIQLKINEFARKQEAKDQKLRQKKHEFGTQMQRRFENSMQRNEYITSRQLEKIQRDERERSYRTQKLQEKMLRSERVHQQKKQVHQALHNFRIEMNMQENLLRENFHEMERTGRFTNLVDLDATMFCATLGRSALQTSYPTRRRPVSAHPTVMREDMRTHNIQQTKSVPAAWASKKMSAWDADEDHDGLLDPEEGDLKSKEDILRDTFKKEIYDEMERQNALAQVQDPDEFQRLLKLFSAERKESMGRIHKLATQ